jgi:hypothetical protein
MPFMGMYSGSQSGSHDLFAPIEWPVFELNGSIVEEVQKLRTGTVQDVSAPEQWYCNEEIAGRDSYLHLRPCHVAPAMEILLEAQLRLGGSTAFTVVTPAVGLQDWRKYLKHFHRKEIYKVVVPGLGEVKHWLLRFEAGDGLLPRGEREGQEGESEEIEGQQ